MSFRDWFRSIKKKPEEPVVLEQPETSYGKKLLHTMYPDKAIEPIKEDLETSGLFTPEKLRGFFQIRPSTIPEQMRKQTFKLLALHCGYIQMSNHVSDAYCQWFHKEETGVKVQLFFGSMRLVIYETANDTTRLLREEKNVDFKTFYLLLTDPYVV